MTLDSIRNSCDVFVKRKLWASSRMFGNLDHIEVREAGGSLIVRKKLVFRQSLFYNILVDIWWTKYMVGMVGIWTKYRQTDR